METGIDTALDVGSEGAEGEFAVVAGADAFADGRGAGGLQSGEEDAGFDLGAGNGRGVVDRCKLRAVDVDGCVAFGEGESGAHGFEGKLDALHGAARKGGVADEGEFALLG